MCSGKSEPWQIQDLVVGCMISPKQWLPGSRHDERSVGGIGVPPVHRWKEKINQIKPRCLKYFKIRIL